MVGGGEATTHLVCFTDYVRFFSICEMRKPISSRPRTFWIRNVPWIGLLLELTDACHHAFDCLGRELFRVELLCKLLLRLITPAFGHIGSCKHTKLSDLMG